MKITVYIILELIWFMSIVLGYIYHQEERPVHLPLMSYDKILRTLGPILPHILFLFRCSLECPCYFRLFRCHLFPYFKIYLFITISRLFIYFCHLTLEHMVHKWLPSQHLISDHVLLGASMTAIFQSESNICLNHLCHVMKSHPSSKLSIYSFLTCCCFVLNCLLSILTSLDMFYTVLYFHPRFQSFLGALFGSGFQLYLALFLISDSKLNQFKFLTS